MVARKNLTFSAINGLKSSLTQKQSLMVVHSVDFAACADGIASAAMVAAAVAATKNRVDRVSSAIGMSIPGKVVSQLSNHYATKNSMGSHDVFGVARDNAKSLSRCFLFGSGLF